MLSKKPAPRKKGAKIIIPEREENKESAFKLPLFNEGKQQQIGLISLKNIQCKRRTSFLDLIADQLLELVPIIGVDFSMSNITFDNRKCLHSVNEDN